MSTGKTTIASSARRRGGPASAWLYPVALILIFSGLVGLLPSAILGEGLLEWALIAVVVLALATNLIFARVPQVTPERTLWDFVVIALVAVLLTSFYWFRVALGVSGWDVIGLKIVMGLAWWLPAVAFAVLYRHPGERWLEQGRGRFLARVSVAVVASLAGLPTQSVLKEQHALHVEHAGLPQAVEELAARTLPDGATMRFELEGRVLTLHVGWPERGAGGSYRQLAMLINLAGDAGRMQPGGADRLVRRVNVDRVNLEVRRGDQILATMDWPQAGLQRGAQALEIDYDAAGLSRLPDQADLDDLLRSLPPHVRTGELCSRALDEQVWIGRCNEIPSPVTAQEFRALKRDWSGANILIRELSRVFPAISGFRLELAGYELDVPPPAAADWVDARKWLPVPDGTARLWVSDDPDGQPPEAESTAAPVNVVWRDGHWGPGHNHVELWPWQVGELSAAGLRIYLLELSPEGGLRLFLEPIDPRSGVPNAVTLMPGESIDWEDIHLRHLGW
ncbi:hypothetical protein LRB11_16300 [Ectothiorhodospira haloalkaliphila]|uniref:hypothetical protein n=1 Tax=Ectothiorhodospira TaxID=1051 RepID=UPI001EE8A19C|nr:MULTISPECIES: hypothetical protein [Ectothiorhodospira]MCG5497659.1 hypothetical protein [Ectothiorhodospira variabilis]MCG5526466.1 hypothetical protein [Ectothiorhodospira haloalkaliphila]